MQLGISHQSFFCDCALKGKWDAHHTSSLSSVPALIKQAMLPAIIQCYLKTFDQNLCSECRYSARKKKNCNAIRPLAEVYERQCLPGPVGGGNGSYEPYKLSWEPCWSDLWLMSTGGWIPSQFFVISYQCHRNHHKLHRHHESARLGINRGSSTSSLVLSHF